MSLATRPPHVRSALNVPAVMRCVLVGAAPCVAMALYNTGYQANLAVSLGASSPSGWRDLPGAIERVGGPEFRNILYCASGHVDPDFRPFPNHLFHFLRP